jgi:dTDP-4-amino-4,6-dideoxygalactose transaminase
MATANCGEPGRSPFELVADWMSGSGPPRFPGREARRVVFTQSGRAAIRLAAQVWNIGASDEVLVPAYNCGSEISPLLATGARVHMYRVDSGARIDIGDLLRRITERTRLVHVTHYFGRPTNLGDLVAICRERQIKLLEDCALSLFTDAVGQSGDAAVFSLRKSLPACDGGVLLLHDQDGDACTPTQPAPVIATVRGALSLVKKWLPLRSGSLQEDGPPALGEFSLPDIPASYYWADDAVVRKASRFAPGVLQRTDPQHVVRARRANYHHLRQCLDGTPGVGLLWQEPTLAEGVCPLGLPILVDDRRRWWRGLNSAGVTVSCWWEGYHRTLDWSEFPEARMLKDRLILLPVHQGLTVGHMAKLADAVRSLADG